MYASGCITLNPKDVGLQGNECPQPPPPRDHLVLSFPVSPPRDHLVWSLFNFVYINPCCCAFWALLYSIQARDRLHAGDVEGARSRGRKAWRVNVIVTAVYITLIIASVTYYVFR